MPRRTKTTVRAAAPSRSGMSTVEPSTEATAPIVQTTVPESSGKTSDRTDHPIDLTNSTATSTDESTQGTNSAVVTPTKHSTTTTANAASTSTTKRQIIELEQSVATSSTNKSATNSKKAKTKLGITAVDFSCDEGLNKAFKALQPLNTPIPKERLALIAAILNAYSVEQLKVLWSTRATGPWPAGRKNNGVMELTSIISNEFHVTKTPTHSKDAPTNR